MYPNTNRLTRLLIATLAVAVGACLSRQAAAEGFSAVVSPPRFEGAVKPGETFRDVVEITNVGAQPNQIQVKTADWRLDANGAAQFSDELAPDSCRPWVAIERHELTLGARGKYRFRFEVAVPADAPARECRFGMMFEGASQQVDAGGLKLPVSGRIGVIVYLEIGGVASALTLAGYGTQVVNGNKVPSLKIANHGTAHGRLDGFIEGTDADGKSFTLIPSTLPILPGEEREIALTFDDSKNQKRQVQPHYPLVLKGQVYDGHSPIDVSTTFSP